MKFKVTFKHPDAVDEALNEVAEEHRDAARRMCKKFFEYGEYVTVEVDTEKRTATVIPAKDY